MYKQHPISIYKQEILNSILTNRITFIGGEPGIGKSTQVTFFIIIVFKALYRIDLKYFRSAN